MRKRMEKTAPYLYILPMILVVGIVIIYPIIELFIGSLTSTSYDGKTIFVGLSNFKLVVADPLFKTAIINNLKLFLMVPVLTLVSLVLPRCCQTGYAAGSSTGPLFLSLTFYPSPPWALFSAISCSITAFSTRFCGPWGWMHGPWIGWAAPNMPWALWHL